MKEIAIVLDHVPEEAEAKGLASLGFTNIMVDLEKKLLGKQPQEGVRVVSRSDLPSDLMVKEWKAEGITRVIVHDGGPSIPLDSVEVPAAPENVTNISEAGKQPKMNKIQQKRLMMYIERRKRAINKGIPEDQVDRHLAQEDWNNAPMPEKVARLEHMIASSFRGLSQDIMSLRQNQSSITDAFDMNNRMVYRMMTKLGLSAEDQKLISEEVAADFAVQQKLQAEALQAKQKGMEKKAVDLTEKSELERMTKEDKVPEPQGALAPEGSTVFGG